MNDQLLIFLYLFIVMFHEDTLWRQFYLFEFKLFQQMWKFQAAV